MRYLLTVGAVFFRESKWKIREFFGAFEGEIEVFILYGEKGKEIWDSLEWHSLENVESKAFPDAGWYVMRSGRNYCIISHGPNGQNENGGHCHNDKLSFELCLNGEDLIVDPGTYVYTVGPEMRNRFRGTAYHNTLMVDGQEQNRSDKGHLFCLGNDTLARCLKWQTGDGMDVFIGEHCGYKRLSNSVIHQRQIRFHKADGTIEVVDRFTGQGRHSLEWNLVLSPDLQQDLRVHSKQLGWRKEPAFYSPGYGVITETRKLTSKLRTTIPAEVEFRICRSTSICEADNKAVREHVSQ